MRFLSVLTEITLDNEFKIPFTFLYILLLSKKVVVTYALKQGDPNTVYLKGCPQL